MYIAFIYASKNCTEQIQGLTALDAEKNAVKFVKSNTNKKRTKIEVCYLEQGKSRKLTRELIKTIEL